MMLRLLRRLPPAASAQLPTGLPRRALSSAQLPLHRLPDAFAGVEPPGDEAIRRQVAAILERNGVQAADAPLDLQLKFNVLVECECEFQCVVQNKDLAQIGTAEDAVRYFQQQYAAVCAAKEEARGFWKLNLPANVVLEAAEPHFEERRLPREQQKRKLTRRARVEADEAARAALIAEATES